MVRAVFADTSTLGARRTLLWTVGHREHVGIGPVAPALAIELEDRLRDQITALPPGDLASQDRIAGLADLMAETDEGKAAVLTDCVSTASGRELGAAAVKGTKVVPWEGLIEWFGENVLVRRIAELLTAITGGMKTSEERRGALTLAAD